MQVIELLNSRVAELEARKNSVEGTDYDAIIEEEVAKFRAERVEFYKAERDAKLEGVDDDIAALKRWLAEEEAKFDKGVEIVEEPQPAPVVVESPKVSPIIPAAFQKLKIIN